MEMISIPVAVHNELFKWQLSLFWHQHKKLYGKDAYKKAHAVIVKRNNSFEPKKEVMEWDMDIPHTMTEAYFDICTNAPDHTDFLPLNIQCSLYQILGPMPDEQLIEILDCDMFHFRKHPIVSLGENEILVSHIYEDWHLKSLTDNRPLIEKYFLNGGAYYCGGFVPIIARVGTIKRILMEWMSINKDIAESNLTHQVKWWGGMFALQAACERQKIQMIGRDLCYVPRISEFCESHYIGHYSVDDKFDKRKFPHLDVTKFQNNLFYEAVLDWINQFFAKKD